ncbi:hypothetical protein BJ741DRAFT_616515 [Chytriomyces cf. hyalinus JEL632]|nr:hypothetical protein BJ741DRAFT_616515 [Chytriomyces cf. hyalinus JEL632]
MASTSTPRPYAFAATTALSESRADESRASHFVTLEEAVEMHFVGVVQDGEGGNSSCERVEDRDRDRDRERDVSRNRHPLDREEEEIRSSVEAAAAEQASFQTRTIRPAVVNEYADDEDEISRTSVAATTVAVLNLRYNDPDGHYLDQEMPFELEGLIPTHVYTDRITRINKRLGQFSTLRDYMPVLRTSIFFVFIVFSLLFVLLASQFSAVLLWCVSFLGLGSMFCALLYTYYKPHYERFIESEMAAFCAQDEHIQLLWKSARNYHQPMFTCDWSKRAAQVPWRILITHVNKHGADGHFLPAYSPGGVVHDGAAAAEGSHNSALPFLVARVQGTLLNPDANGTRRGGGADAGSRAAAAAAANTATSPSSLSLPLSPATAESAADGTHRLAIPSVAANKALPSGKRKKENGRTRSNENGASSSSSTGGAREFVDSAPLRSEDDDDDHDDDPDFSGDLRMTKTGTQVSKPPSYRSYIA